MKTAVAKGDGIGPEIMDAVMKIFEANKVPLEYELVEMGKWVFDKGFSNGMTPEAQHTIENLGILFKGPMETPKGKGVKSVNVTARKTWNTYANKRVFQTLPRSETLFFPKQGSLSTLLLYVRTSKIPMVGSNICSHTMLRSVAVSSHVRVHSR